MAQILYFCTVFVNTNGATFVNEPMDQKCSGSDHAIGENLRRLMTREGITIGELVDRSGLDHRTIKRVLRSDQRPQPRTLHRLASALEADTDELFQNPALLAQRQFNRATNPLVDEVIASEPALFANWTTADFDELYSRVGTGGALTAEGARDAVVAMNDKREMLHKVAVVLETEEAVLLKKIVDTLYERVAVTD